jgi:tetratricopeptide (TPR) repeat protein
MGYSPMELADAFIRAGELADALDALNQQLTDNPGDDDARRLRAQVLMRLLGDTQLRQAVDDLEKIMQPTADDELRRALLLEQLGEFEGALKVIGAVHAANPQNEQLAERYFWLLFRLRRYTDARELLQHMPRSWDWRMRAGDLATEDGNAEHAPEYYSEALELLGEQFNLATDAFARPIQTQLLMSRGQAYATLTRFHEAEADYTAAQALMPDDPMIPFWRSFVLLELGRADEALDLCRLTLTGANANYRDRMQEQIRSLASNPTFALLAALLEE